MYFGQTFAVRQKPARSNKALRGLQVENRTFEKYWTRPQNRANNFRDPIQTRWGYPGYSLSPLDEFLLWPKQQVADGAVRSNQITDILPALGFHSRRIVIP